MEQELLQPLGIALICAQVHVPKRKGTHAMSMSACRFLVRPAGIEPAAYSLGGYRSIQLSYERAEAK